MMATATWSACCFAVILSIYHVFQGSSLEPEVDIIATLSFTVSEANAGKSVSNRAKKTGSL